MQLKITKTQHCFSIVACMIGALASLTPLSVHAIPARFAVVPDSNYSLLISTINSARQSLVINIYEFERPEIAQALVRRIRDGVKVQLLVEGQPFTGHISPEGREVLKQIRDAMGSANHNGNRLYVMIRRDKDIKRRYRFNHAKYVLVDSSSVLVSSENFTNTGHADPGSIGNRGWETVLHEPDLARSLQQIFESDSDLRHNDVLLINRHDPIPGELRLDHFGTDGTWFQLENSNWGALRILTYVKELARRTVPSIQIGDGDVKSIELISSPDALDGLTRAIRSAKISLDLEQMSFPKTWREKSSSEPFMSPLVHELVSAARRGVKVRVLLNDETVYGHDPDRTPYNVITVSYLKDVAKKEHLKIFAEIVKHKAVEIKAIHNKGILIDGKFTLVSSINGTRTSVLLNREIALLMESEAAARYFGQAFEFDWKQSTR